MPRMFSRRDGNAAHQWRDTYRPRYQQIVARWAGRAAPDLSVGRLLDSIAELLAAAAEYYTSVQMIIPVAATTELTFASIDAKSLQHADDPQAMTFILGLDSLPMRAERDLYDPAVWCRDQPGLVQAIAEVEHPDELAFGERRSRWLETSRSGRSGSGSSATTSAGSGTPSTSSISPIQCPLTPPGPVLDALRFYARGEGPDQRIRQQRQAAERKQATKALLARLDPVRGKLIGGLLHQAQQYGPIREDALADIGLAWPTLRRNLRELGRRLVEASAIADVDDVFWLRLAEGRAFATALDTGSSSLRSIGDTAAERRMTWRGQRLVAPPQLLPKNRVNDFVERWMPTPSGADQTGPVLKGLAASGGQVTGDGRADHRAGSLLLDATWQDHRRQDHHTGLHALVRHGFGGGHRRRGPAQSQLDRRPRVRHRRRVRNRGGNRADQER